MLKLTRRIIASVLFVLLTLLFLDFTGTLHLYVGWLAKIQLLPAILAHSAGILLFLLLLTLVLGRVYCSVICPLGVLQDGVSWFASRRKKNRFRYSPAVSWLRYGVLAVFIVALVAGVSVIVSLLDPYAAYGRIASNLLAPLYRWGNNLLAFFAEKADSYAFYSADVWVKGWLTFGISVATLVIVGVLAWRNGRTYCNTICPVGTALGFLSKFSFFKVKIDTEKCNSCGLCARNCKASCIDSKTHTIDYSRCVVCFNCLEKCNTGAITVSKLATQKVADATDVSVQKEGISRREALSLLGAVAVAGAVKAQKLSVDGGLAEIQDKKMPVRKVPLAPPGAQSLKHLQRHCTACQLCVSACPNNVLRPSAALATLMQPEMAYDRGYCRPECVECSQVCPNHAIRPITVADKSVTSIGTAVWVRENCLVITQQAECRSCESHCPAQAIVLVPLEPEHKDSPRYPVVDKMKCIGCGACEYLCPARPFSAIYVEGNVMHREVF